MNWDLSKYKNQTDWSSKNLILIGEFHKSLKTKGKSFLLELSTKDSLMLSAQRSSFVIHMGDLIKFIKIRLTRTAFK